MNNWYANSSDASDWQANLGVLVPSAIAALPVDPVNSCPQAWDNYSTDCYSYTYWSVLSDWSNFTAPCPQGMGVMYILIARLENVNDPDAIGAYGSPKRIVCGRDIQDDLYKTIGPGFYLKVGY